MINKTKVSFIMVLFLLTLSLSFFVSAESYIGQCSLDSCPSGYSEVSVSCSNKLCARECKKQTGGNCGTYDSGTYAESKKTITVGENNNKQNTWFSISKTFSDTTKCYVYFGEARFEVTDSDPGGFWHNNADSYKLSAKIGSSQESLCYIYPYNSQSSVMTTGKYIRGGDESSSKISANVYPYNPKSCSGSVAYGISGDLYISIYYKTANFNPTFDTKRFTCSYTCDSDNDCPESTTGNAYCQDNALVKDVKTYSCQNYQCQETTNQEGIEICTNGCENNKCKGQTCTEGYIGSKTCSGNTVVQSYKNSDCTVITKDLEQCTTSCLNGLCDGIVPPPECTSDLDCAEGEVCTAGTCEENNNSWILWTILSIVGLIVLIIIYLIVRKNLINPRRRRK